MEAGWQQVEHTADVALELWAPSEPELLRVGARALIDLLTGGAQIQPTASRPVAIDAIDREDRLVQWLNHVIVAAVTDGFLYAGAELTLGETSLVGEISGEAAADRVRTELKSATYHDLSLRRDASGMWRALVVIDV